MGKRTDFSEYTTGVAATDWTERWSSSKITSEIIKSGDAYEIGKALKVMCSASVRQLLSWNVLDGIADLDITMIYRNNDVSDDIGRVYARCSGSLGAEYGYYVVCTESSLLLVKYVNGTPTIITSVSIVTYDASLYCVRFRVVGNSLKVKFWGGFQLEPYDWSLSATDNDISAGGWAGVGGFGADYFQVFFISAGYNGSNPIIDDRYLSGISPTLRVSTITPFPPADSTPANFVSAMGFMLPAGTVYSTSEMRVYCLTYHNAQIRMAVYAGGSLSGGPSGAKLLADFGQTSGSDTSTYISVTGSPVILPTGVPLWAAFKGNVSTASLAFTVLYTNTAGLCGSYQKDRGRYDSPDMNKDPSVAFPSEWVSESGTFSSSWYCVQVGLTRVGAHVPRFGQKIKQKTLLRR